MYMNIDTDHGIATMENWLALHKYEIPSGFPTAKILNGLDIIIRNNIFTLGNRCWK
jgi:hypothetical protein